MSPPVSPPPLAPGASTSGNVTGDVCTVQMLYVDDSQSTKLGTWYTSPITPGSYLGTYVHDGNQDKGLKSLIYPIPMLSGTSSYIIEEKHSSSPANLRSSNVKVTLMNGGTLYQTTIDQTVNDNTWNQVFPSSFVFQTGDFIQLFNDGTNNYVVADAFRFVCIDFVPPPSTMLVSLENEIQLPNYGVPDISNIISSFPYTVTNYTVESVQYPPPPPSPSSTMQYTPICSDVILDNLNASTIGQWTYSVVVSSEAYGGSYIHDNNELKGQKKAIYTVPPLHPGSQYDLYEMHSTTTNTIYRSPNVTIELSMGGTISNIFVNQQISGGQWNQVASHLSLQGGIRFQ